MQPITTRSTRERIIRNSLLTVMLLGFAAWSFYDGYEGYPQDNLEQARKALPADAQASAEINPQITRDSLPPIGVGLTMRELIEQIGPPAWQGEAKDNIYRAYWFGPAITLIVRYDSMKYVTEAEVRDGVHTETDLVVQKGMGVVVGLLGLYALIRIIGMVAGRVTLSDAGLKPPLRPLIPYDAMTGWDTTEYKEKGRIYLAYAQNGDEKVYVLDDYKLAAFRPIVDEISARTGFANPFEDQDPSAKTPESETPPS